MNHTIIKHLFLVFSLFVSINVHSTNIDSLLNVHTQLDGTKNKKLKISSYLNILNAYQAIQDHTNTLKVAKEGLEFLEEIKEDTLKGDILYFLGYASQWLSDYNMAMAYYDQCLEELENNELKNAKRIGAVYGRKAIIYRSQGKYELAFKEQLESIKIAEAINDSIDIATATYELGSLFYYQKQYDKALEYYQKAQTFTNASKKGKQMLFSCLAATGTTYENLKMLKKALEYNRAAYEIAIEINHISGIGYALSNMGSTYMSMKEYDKAYEYITESLKIKQKQKDIWGEIGTLRTLADMFIKKGEPKLAIPYLENAFELSTEIESKTRQLEILELLSKAYKDMGNYKRALVYSEDFTALKDSVLNETTVEQMGELKKNFEIEQKENEILLLKKDNEVLAKEQEIDKLYNYIWTVVAMSFGVLLLLFVSRYKAQKKSSDLLKEKNEQINHQNSELQKVNDLLSDTNTLLEQNKVKIEEQNKALESSNEDLRNFASVASHDLKEPLRMINAYTSILRKKYDGLFDERAHEFMGYVVDGVTRMEQLINSLLDYSRVSIDGGNENLKRVNLRNIVEIVKGNLRFPIVKSSATINIEDYDNFPIVMANQVQMMQLIQNLVSNALKFKGERLPVVTIGFETKNDYHTFYIKDNGIGISKENQMKIFDMLTRLHTKQEYEGTGIGLATVRKIVERHRGKIWVESVEGEGSTFFFTLPVIKTPEMALA